MKIQNNQLIREVVVSINEIQEMQRERENLERQKARIQEHIDRIDFELGEFENLPKKEITKIEKAERAMREEKTQEKPLEIVDKWEPVEKKQADMNIAQQAIADGKIFVNIAKGKAVIHTEYIDWLEYDEDRGDMIFDTMEDAKNFVSEYK